jgi:hypothetical protein
LYLYRQSKGSTLPSGRVAVTHHGTTIGYRLRLYAGKRDAGLQRERTLDGDAGPEARRPIGRELRDSCSNFGSPSGAPPSTHSAITSICSCQTLVVFEFAEALDGAPGRHPPLQNLFLDGRGPRTRLGIGHQGESSASGPMATCAAGVNQARNLACEGDWGCNYIVPGNTYGKPNGAGADSGQPSDSHFNASTGTVNTAVLTTPFRPN